MICDHMMKAHDASWGWHRPIMLDFDAKNGYKKHNQIHVFRKTDILPLSRNDTCPRFCRAGCKKGPGILSSLLRDLLKAGGRRRIPCKG